MLFQLLRSKIFVLAVEHLCRQEKHNFIYGVGEILSFTKGEIFQIKYGNISRTDIYSSVHTANESFLCLFEAIYISWLTSR